MMRFLPTSLYNSALIAQTFQSRYRYIFNSSLSTMTRDQIFASVRSAQAICFDVDSTVIQEEGIDVLAFSKGCGEEVANLTKQAMGGNVPFDVALKCRLDLIKPSLKDFEDCSKKYPFRLTPGVKDFIDNLQSRGVHVYLVSGGFRQMINPIADQLFIPRHRIYANNVIFDDSGAYKGFDTNEPTSKDGGKRAVLQKLIDMHGYKPIIMIGDGATDMQARPPADAFIGFGGVIVRKTVEEGADLFVRDFKELLSVIDDKQP